MSYSEILQMVLPFFGAAFFNEMQKVKKCHAMLTPSLVVTLEPCEHSFSRRPDGAQNGPAYHQSSGGVGRGASTWYFM